MPETGQKRVRHSAAEGSLRNQTIRGAFWLVTQSLGTKLVSVLGQILLAYLLLERDFATISVAYALVAFARVLEAGGVREVLLQRGEDMPRWLGAGFWLSLGLGVVSGLLILAAAAPASAIYAYPGLFWLLALMAFVPVLSALGTIPLAILQSQHRFGVMAGLTAMQGVAQTVATVLFAWGGWGAHSFVFGTLIAGLLYALGLWLAAGGIHPGRPVSGSMRALWGGTLMLSLVALLTVLVQQVDYLLLGAFQSAVTVGLYYFAYSVAAQLSQIVGGNLTTVFLPILCRIQDDPARQLAASRNALQVLAGAALPLAFLQTLAIDPAFRLFLPERWHAAIHLAQVLSLGLGLNLLSGVCWSLIKSQGRFQVIFWLNLAGAVAFSTGVALAAAWGTAMHVAICVLVLCAVYSPLVMWYSIRPIAGGWTDVSAVFLVPLVCSVLAFVPAWGLDRWLDARTVGPFWRLLAVPLVFSAVAGAALLVCNHPVWQELFRIGRMVRSRLLDRALRGVPTSTSPPTGPV